MIGDVVAAGRNVGQPSKKVLESMLNPMCVLMEHLEHSRFSALTVTLRALTQVAMVRMSAGFVFHH